MVIKSIIGTTCTCLAVVSFNTSAAIISADWQTAGDNLITQDTTSGLEWLDLTATTSRSYSDISSKLGSGQEFDGWRYATSTEISGFFDAFGGDSNYYNGWSTQNNGLFDAIAPYWGDTRCEVVGGCSPGDLYSYAINADSAGTGNVWWTILNDNLGDPTSMTQDYISILGAERIETTANAALGSALVRDVSAVPVPAAVWLFGSGLIGLIEVARRKVLA